MDDEPQSGQLVPTQVRCFLCRIHTTIALPAERSIRSELAATTCPTCGRRGAMQLARPVPQYQPEPRVIGTYDEPADDLGDEELLARRVRRET